jgi:hypothetical protein
MEIIEQKIISTKDYYEIDAVSQSALKQISKGYIAYLRALEPSESTSYFKFGAAVDTMLTEPDRFAEDFKVAKIALPSDTIKEIVEIIYKNAGSDIGGGLDNPEFAAFILGTAETVGYGRSWKPETVIKKVVEAGAEYYKFLSDTEGKQILSEEEYERVERCVTKLLTDFYTRDYFHPITDSIEHLYQFPIAWKYVYKDMALNGKMEYVTCKSLLDIVILDHEEKTIKGVDIKTTSKPVSSFSSSFLKFRYDFQAAFYTLALNYYIKTNEKLKDYTILPFEFLVVESNGHVAPVRFVCPEDVIAKAMSTGFTTELGYRYMGVAQAFDDLRWYNNRGGTDVHSREYIYNEGYQELNLNIK